MSSEAIALWTESSSDPELIAGVRAGDSAAFGVLYERHSDAARKVASQYTNSHSDVDDVVSEAFSRVLRALQRGDGPDLAFRAYLFTIVRRTGMDIIDKGIRTKPRDDMSPYESAIGYVASSDEPALDGFEHGMVADAFKSLPERWQAVLWYTEVEKKSPKEIAPLLGLSANGVAALAYRAREALRQAYLQQHLNTSESADCLEANTQLGAYVRGGLSKREHTRIDAHVRSCERCSGLVAELEDVNRGMRSVIAPLMMGILGAGALEGGLPIGGALGAHGVIAASATSAGGAAVGGAGAASAGGAVSAGGLAGLLGIATHIALPTAAAVGVAALAFNGASVLGLFTPGDEQGIADGTVITVPSASPSPDAQASEAGEPTPAPSPEVQPSPEPEISAAPVPPAITQDRSWTSDGETVWSSDDLSGDPDFPGDLLFNDSDDLTEDPTAPDQTPGESDRAPGGGEPDGESTRGEGTGGEDSGDQGSGGEAPGSGAERPGVDGTRGEAPGAGKAPGIPSNPIYPGAPSGPVERDYPSSPETPVVPADPRVPVIPQLPALPATPTVPVVPAVPTLPPVLTEPGVPTDPAPAPTPTARLAIGKAPLGFLEISRSTPAVTLSVANQGDAAARDITAQITLPDGLEIVSPDGGAGFAAAVHERVSDFLAYARTASVEIDGWECTIAEDSTTASCILDSLEPAAVSSLKLNVAITEEELAADSVTRFDVRSGDLSETYEVRTALAPEGDEDNPLDPGYSGGRVAVQHFGGTVMSCFASPQAADTNNACMRAMEDQSTGLGSKLTNNDWNMRPINLDGGEHNSGTTAITLPEGATVMSAYLEWSANRYVSDMPDRATDLWSGALDTAQVKVGDGEFVTVTAESVDDSVVEENRQYYLSRADVTDLVLDADGEILTVADIAIASTQNERNVKTYYGGFALTVVYQDPLQPVPSEVALFEGPHWVRGSTPVSIRFHADEGATITPSWTAYEGDRGNKGDIFMLDGESFEPLSQTGEVRDSRDVADSTAYGSPWGNTLGVDAKKFSSKVIKSTGTYTVRASTSGDNFMIGTIAITITEPADEAEEVTEPAAPGEPAEPTAARLASTEQFAPPQQPTP